MVMRFAVQAQAKDRVRILNCSIGYSNTQSDWKDGSNGKTDML